MMNTAIKTSTITRRRPTKQTSGSHSNIHPKSSQIFRFTARWLNKRAIDFESANKLDNDSTALRGTLHKSENKMLLHNVRDYHKVISKSLASLLLVLLLQTNSDNSQSVKAQTSLHSSLYLPSSSFWFSSQPSTTPQQPTILKRDLSAKQEPSMANTLQRTNVCQVNGGESVAIVEIEESRGSDINQNTNPMELPISGSVSRGEIELRIESETHKYFQIQEKRLRLKRPLDRDPILKENLTQIQQQPISSIYLQISCLDKRSPDVIGEELRGSHTRQPRKVIIPVLVKVLDLNDNAPNFSSPVYTVQVDELTPLDSIVTNQIYAIDLDSANNGLIEYSLLGSKTSQQFPAPSSSRSSSRLIQRAKIDQLQTITRITTTTGLPMVISNNARNVVDVAQAAGSSAVISSGQQVDHLGTTALLSNNISNPGLASGLTRSSNSPTINLNSEPIMNGPMEDSSEEEESDEALLASMNSTDIMANTETDVDTLAASPSSTGRRRRKRSSSGQSFKRQPTTPFPSQLTDQQLLEPNNKLKLDLWTNLMASSSIISDDLLAVDSRLQPAQTGSSVDFLTNSNYWDQLDSLEYFGLELAPNTNKPIIKLKKQLDYESKRVHVLIIEATDMATNKLDRLTSTATIVIRVLDGDDQGPAFMLDQGGCATGSVPQITTTSPLMVTDEPSTVSLISGHQASKEVNPFPQSQTRSRRDLIGTSVGARQDNDGISLQRMALHLPRGFKVTDENFDFSDISHGDSDELADEEQLSLRLISQADPIMPAANSTVQRARRFPVNPSLADSAYQWTYSQHPTTISPTHTLLSKSRLSSSKSHLDIFDYSCLSGSPAASGMAEYFAAAKSGDSDYLLRVAPQAIKARDRDQLNAPIRYTFINGTPSNYSLYFQINPLDASLKQIAPIDRNQIDKFVIWVQAQEQTVNKLSSLAKLSIDVLPNDKNPPVLVPNSYAGFVEENAPIGSNVFIVAPDMVALARNNNINYSSLMRINVLDADHPAATGAISDLSASLSPSLSSGSRNVQIYEFETTSDAFKVNKDGFVYVNKWPLDRDLPNQAVHMFQVTARQIGLASSRSMSSPISINVTLLDLNDNPPLISNNSLVPIQMMANNRASRIITIIRATDNDLPENARMFFSIHHVSNNGKERFRINKESGELEALGKFNSGEQFSLTIQVTDELGRTSQGILELLVKPGPNTGGPQFIVDTDYDNSRGYSIEINEGIAPHSVILQVQALDPENDPIAYSIVDGNINNDFYINFKTGHIYVNNKLDREEVSAYNLLVQARDSGGLATNRPVYISISDNNDQNPVFSQTQYSFSVDEGVAGQRTFGRVSATDGDAGENGQISYLLESAVTDDGRTLFQIDERTGDLRVAESLDYERAKSHTLIVIAKDHGENPRSTTASVLVRVLDVQDETPYFERYYIESRIAENLAQHKVAQVQARDPDSIAQITYVLKSGDSSLFQVDPQSGIVSTIRGLDFEESRAHSLIIGTIEHQKEETAAVKVASGLVEWKANLLATSPLLTSSGLALNRSPICRIDVTVIDINDNVPHFVNQPLPVRIQDSVQLGTVVINLTAEDRDASEPNNQIRYELLGREASTASENGETYAVTSDRCLQSFMIDATSGTISVKSDLKRDSKSECHLLVRVRDLGQYPQSLSSTTIITVFIDHIAEISPTSMMGFADTSFTVELEENSPPNTLVKVLPIINKPKMNFPMSCEILSGNEHSKFYVVENEQRDCELRISNHQIIDYELRQRYTLTLKLNTIGGSSKTLAQININILDKNDNRPIFQHPSRYSHLTQNRFLAAIANDAPSETQVLQLRASDLDSPHSNGLVSYEILNDNELESRFKVDLIDGIVRTSRPVEDIPNTRLPIRLKVIARDNPEVTSNSLDAIAEIVVNLIEDRHRIALVFKDITTGRVLDNKEELLRAIQERTGLISGMEKVESLKMQKNGTLESDVSGTDFWFYLIEPGTFRIVASDDLRVRGALLEQRSHNSLLDIIGQTLGFQKARVRLPFSLSNSVTGRSSSVLSSRSFLIGSGGKFSSALILVALFIAITSTIVIIYQCGFWSSYSRATKAKLYLQQQQQQQQSYYQYAGFGLPKSQHSLTTTSHDNYAFRSGFSSMTQHPQSSLLSQQLHQVGLRGKLPTQDGEPIYQLEHPAATLNQEYETQMLKMSVLFDDNHSLDEQNLNEKNIIKNLN